MNDTKTILFFYGTRPEIIKLAPIITEFKKYTNYNTKVCHTGQHKELTLELEKIFGIVVNYRLNIENKTKDLNTNLAEIITKANDLLNETNPDLVLIQGDTTTVMAVALASFNLGIKVGHIEAGLRSFNMKEPFPEELNRRIATLCADFHFVPTHKSFENLKKEGIPTKKIWNTGNTVVDALIYIKKLFKIKEAKEKLILVTAHRRENHGKPLENICNAIIAINNEFKDYTFIWPLHPNPKASNIVKRKLSNRPNIILIPPQPYNKLIELMAKATLIWTDSGGIQEEAPYFKKPVLILRNVTERPEVIESGFGILVGTETDKIIATTKQIISHSAFQEKLITQANPFGNGTAAKKIVKIISEKL